MGTRREAFTRLLISVPFLVLYILVLFPLAFALGIVLGAVDVVWRLLTGREGIAVMSLYLRFLGFVSDNLRYVFSGRGEWQWMP